MSGGDWIYWLGWVLVVVVNLAMIYLTWWGLFGDKARGRRRCPKCWYDLSGSEGLTCSECGHVARSENDVRRGRRRWSLALLGIVVCVLVAAFVNDRITRQGWTGIVPTKVMIVGLPVLGDEDSALCRELTRRVRSARLSDSEWAMLMRRAVKGDWWARPVSDDWMDKYAGYVTRRRGFVERQDEVDWDVDIAEALLALPPRVELTTRETWPATAPVHISMQFDEWWPGEWESRITAVSTTDPEAAQTMMRHSRTRRNYTFSIPPLDQSADAVAIDVLVERRGPLSEPWEVVHRGSVALETRLEGEIEDLLSPSDDESLDEAIRQTFDNGVVRWTEGGPAPVRVFFTPRSTYFTAFDDVAIGARVELLFDGEIARILDLWWLAGRMEYDDRGVGWEAGVENLDLLEDLDADDDRWQMRVTGDPGIALRAGDATRYWRGSFTVPLLVQEREGVAPDLDWTREDGSDEASDRRSDEG